MTKCLRRYRAVDTKTGQLLSMQTRTWKYKKQLLMNFAPEDGVKSEEIRHDLVQRFLSQNGLKRPLSTNQRVNQWKNKGDKWILLTANPNTALRFETKVKQYFTLQLLATNFYKLAPMICSLVASWQLWIKVNFRPWNGNNTVKMDATPYMILRLKAHISAMTTLLCFPSSIAVIWYWSFCSLHLSHTGSEPLSQPEHLRVGGHPLVHFVSHLPSPRDMICYPIVRCCSLYQLK